MVVKNNQEYIGKGVQCCQGMVYYSGQDIWARTRRTQELHNPSILMCAKALAKLITWHIL